MGDQSTFLISQVLVYPPLVQKLESGGGDHFRVESHCLRPRQLELMAASFPPREKGGRLLLHPVNPKF